MAAQIALESLGIPVVLAKVNDPVRARAYAELGIATINRTNLMRDVILAFAGLPVSGDPPVYVGHGHGHDHPMDVPLDAASRPPGRAGLPLGTTREG